MKQEQLNEQEFPFLFDQQDILQACQQFLNGTITRGEFEIYVRQKNLIFKREDETQDRVYRSGGMGRLGIMDGSPECALTFRTEINRILGETLTWE